MSGHNDSGVVVHVALKKQIHTRECQAGQAAPDVGMPTADSSA